MAGGDCKTKTHENIEGLQDSKKNKNKKKKGKDATVETISEVLKALPQEQQVATLLSKYADLVEENRNMQATVKTIERNSQQLEKEKEKVEREHSKAILTRSRLESLCRELQRQNKSIKDENMVRLKAEEEARNKVSSQLGSKLSEISHLMEENTQKNLKLQEENQKMGNCLEDLVAQYEKREDHVEKILKQREMEVQLAETKLAKLQMEVHEQKEKMLTERKGLLEELSSLQDKLQEKALTEISLRRQLNSYTEKFEEFQESIEHANKVMKDFRKEVEDSSKTIKMFEKERNKWKDKYESTNIALYQMFNDRNQLEAKLECRNKQNTQLQSLCRALQQQIKELREQQRNEGLPKVTLTKQQNDLIEKDPAQLSKTPSPPPLTPEGESFLSPPNPDESPQYSPDDPFPNASRLSPSDPLPNDLELSSPDHSLPTDLKVRISEDELGANQASEDDLGAEEMNSKNDLGSGEGSNNDLQDGEQTSKDDLRVEDQVCKEDLQGTSEASKDDLEGCRSEVDMEAVD